MAGAKHIWRLSFLLLALVPMMWAQTPSERQILDGVNAARAQHGLPQFHWNAALAGAAQTHADRMVKEKTLSHRYPGEPSLAQRAAMHGARFRVIAENIAMNISPDAIVKQWLKSPPHLANILNPKLNATGIGLAKRGSYYFAVEDFSDAVASLTRAQIEHKIDALLLRQGIQPTGPVRDARQTCEMPSGTAGGSNPRFVVRWESPDLSHLPAALENQIRTGRYHIAAVGACDSMHPQQDFTTYRVAVLLY